MKEEIQMKIYDITQELFACSVYPGDPSPERQVKLRIADGAVCNLTAFQMCAHNGTHVDAPYHFVDGGKTIDQVALERFIGSAYVTEHQGDITAADAEAILAKARSLDAEAAKVFAGAGILLFGNESQTVGPLDAPMNVHLIMLGAEIVLLEGIRLGAVEEGIYLLNAAPLNLGGADGAPCRAVLMEL